jgi:NitT/TauT family transport system permease protein
MSSLEMLALLELAQGRPLMHGQERDQASSIWEAFLPTIRRLIAFGKRSLVLLVLLALWEAIPRLGLADPTFLPPFSEVIAAGWQLAQSGELYDDVAASLLRALSGFLISVVLIVPLGLAVGWYARLGDLLNQFIEVCRNTAPLALLPVFILLLGIGELSKVTMVVYSCAWPLLLNTIAAVKQVDPLLVKSARTMGASPQ